MALVDGHKVELASLPVPRRLHSRQVHHHHILGGCRREAVGLGTVVIRPSSSYCTTVSTLRSPSIASIIGK
jgi:hypothetical protein